MCMMASRSLLWYSLVPRLFGKGEPLFTVSYELLEVLYNGHCDW